MNEPTTTAGRALADAYSETWGKLTRKEMDAGILAIEQEAVAKYRQAIEALPGTDVTGRALDYPGGGSLISRPAVLALLGEPDDD